MNQQQQSSVEHQPFYNINDNHQRELLIVNSNQMQNSHGNNNHNGGRNCNHENNQNNFNYQPVSELAKDPPSSCRFYIKTGACRFGPGCSKIHPKYENSRTILIPNFFQHQCLGIPKISDRRTDSGMENKEEVEMIHEFEKFYDNVIKEFRAAGNIVMFKCCRNFVPHLRGNVYVQYSRAEHALEAMRMFNGRFYVDRLLTVELTPVTNWKSSMCGLFDKGSCPRGKACNFLHVFHNPGNAYPVRDRTDFNPQRASNPGGYDPILANPVYPESAVSNASTQRNKWDNDENEKSHSRSRSPDRNSGSQKKDDSHSRSADDPPSNCKFYIKTGACRFGPGCSQIHPRYENSPTIMIPNFFQHRRLGMQMSSDGEMVSGMENEEEVEMIHEFEKFYDHVIVEFRAAGEIVMFKCCRNFVPHLRGNVYIQYSEPKYALEAVRMFNGRFCFDRQLTVELCPVTNWKSSICRLFGNCRREKACNYLHVFHNPGNEYAVLSGTDFEPERAFKSGGYDPSFVNPVRPEPDVSNSPTHRNKWDNGKNEKPYSRSRSWDRDCVSQKKHYSHSRSLKVQESLNIR